MKRGFTKAFLLALALLLGTELGMRLFFARNMSGRFDYGYNPTAGFVEKPDGTVNLVRAGGRRFRPQKFKLEPAPGTYRIFVIGDSVARGPELETAYPWRLKELLAKSGVQAESFNLAVAGYGARRKEIVLRKALEYHPDLIILHVGNSNEYEDEREWRRKQEFTGWQPKNWLMKSLLIRRLYEAKTEQVFWSLLPAEIRNQRAISDADAEVMASRNPLTEKLWNERVQQHTMECVELARQHHVRILLVLQAVHLTGPDGQDHLQDEGLVQLLGPVTVADTDELSMKDVLAGRDYLPLFADGAHMKAAGHDVLAQAILERLTVKGWLPVPAKSARPAGK